ncbi:hypothetical protein, partial [uncultured Sulfitobacter sp.]|uniref:hypothetical protein n=1 Tax=uncultured Sulfitobacter sp. TaxID=191468 RepID=UPI00259ABCD3
PPTHDLCMIAVVQHGLSCVVCRIPELRVFHLLVPEVIDNPLSLVSECHSAKGSELLGNRAVRFD